MKIQPSIIKAILGREPQAKLGAQPFKAQSYDRAVGELIRMPAIVFRAAVLEALRRRGHVDPAASARWLLGEEMPTPPPPRKAKPAPDWQIGMAIIAGLILGYAWASGAAANREARDHAIAVKAAKAVQR